MAPLSLVFSKRTVFAILVVALTARTGVAQLSPWKVPLALTERTSDMSYHELGSLRLTTDKDGDSVLTFGFTTKSEARLMGEYVTLRLGNSSVGEPLLQPLFVARNNTYTQKIDREIAEIVRKFGAEVFVAGEFQSTFFLLSNTLTVGPAKSGITTSPITNTMQEKIAAQLKKLKDAGPKYDSVPPSFTLLTKARVAPPGMTVRYYANGLWSPAEYLGKDQERRAVLRTDPSSRTVTVVEAFDVAVDDKQIAIAGANMQAYKPSLELLPESSIVVPEGFMLNAFLRTLYPGVPVRVYMKGKFRDGFVTKVDGKAITVRGSRIPKCEVVADFYSVIVTPEVHRVLSKLWRDEAVEHFGKFLKPDNTLTPLQAAGRPDLEAELADEEAIEAVEAMEADKIESSRRTQASESEASEMATSPTTEALKPNPEPASKNERPEITRKLKSYPIKIAIPTKTSIVSSSVPLAAGIKLGCNWGSKWYWVTVVDVYSDAAVRIHWDDFGDAWDCDVARSDLIIADQLKKTLERKSESAEMMPRLWKDASEKFKVLAYIDSATESSVRLIKTNGQVLTLPVEKLSQTDQAIIRQKARNEP